MTKIYNISPGFLQAYLTSQDKSKLTPEEIFKRLSFEMGGDGKTITRKQLDDYIDKADSGLIKIDKNRLLALKRIQKNWDKISKGEDSIIYDDMKNYTALLLATVNGSFTATEIDGSKSFSEDDIYDYLVDYLDLSSKEEITESDLASYLNELIANSSDENDSNIELIAAVTNLIAANSSKSTVDTEI